MSFNVIYYVCVVCPTAERTLEMVDKYIEHSARSLQIDMPSKDPYEETDFVKTLMADSLERGDTYEFYMDTIREIRRRHPDLELHVVVYCDVVDTVGIDKFIDFGKEINVASYMIPFVRPEITEALQAAGIPDMKVILNELPDDEVALCQYASSNDIPHIVALRNRKPGENDREGCETWAGRYNYMRNAGVTAPIYSVFGIDSKERLAEVKDSGADGAIIGNVLMRLWDNEEELWKLMEDFQSLYE